MNFQRNRLLFLQDDEADTEDDEESEDQDHEEYEEDEKFLNGMFEGTKSSSNKHYDRIEHIIVD